MDPPQLALEGELWGACCKHFWENWSCHNRTTVYHILWWLGSCFKFEYKDSLSRYGDCYNENSFDGNIETTLGQFFELGNQQIQCDAIYYLANFIKKIHKRLYDLWGVFCGFSLCLIFWLSSCNDVCNVGPRYNNNRLYWPSQCAGTIYSDIKTKG